MLIQSEPHINSVQDLAIDRPSKPCLSFFEKYYKLHPTRVGIDGNFCIFSDAALSQVSHFPSPTDLAVSSTGAGLRWCGACFSDGKG